MTKEESLKFLEECRKKIKNMSEQEKNRLKTLYEKYCISSEDKNRE